MSDDNLVKATLAADEIDKIASLLNIVWPHASLSFKYLKWLYCDNPNGLAYAYNIWEQGEIVAHYAAIPIKAKVFGKIEKGLLSLNTAVHPSSRGKNYFKKLALQTFEDASDQGVSFVVGVANANSTLLFRRQLRFQHVCPLEVKVGVGRVGDMLENKSGYQFVPYWNEDLLKWRLRRPNMKYRIVSGSEGADIYANTGKFGIYAIMGHWGTQDDVLLADKGRNAFRWNPVSLWIGLAPDCDWSGSLYMDLPERFKLSPLNLVFKDLTGQKRTLDPEKISFSLLDFDAY